MPDVVRPHGIEFHQAFGDIVHVFFQAGPGLFPFTAAQLVQPRHNPFPGHELAHQPELFQRHEQLCVAAVDDLQEIADDPPDFPGINAEILAHPVLGMDNVITRFQFLIALDDFGIAEFLFIAAGMVMHLKQFR